MTKARDIANLGDSLINDADDNVALGDGALDSQTTGANNVAIGESALASNTSASNNTAVGFEAGLDNSTGTNNAFIGYRAGYENTTGGSNVAVGLQSLFQNTTGGNNVAIGQQALQANTTASQNTSVGFQSAYSGTTANRLTTVGYQAGYALTTGSGNVVVGDHAFQNATTPDNSVAIGTYCLANTTTGIRNTCVGSAAGEQITTGSKNTILGRYNGNQGGKDIRTSSNDIVLSDGDGNPWLHYDYSLRSNTGGWTSKVGTADMTAQGNNDNYGFHLGTDGFNEFKRVSGQSPVARFALQNATGNLIQFYQGGANVGNISTNGSTTSYNTSSDYRLKENVVDLTGATDRLKQIPVHRFNFIADADTTVDGFLAHEVQAIVPEAVDGTHNEVDADGNPVYQGIDQSKLVPLLVATIKELEARITGLETENTAIKARLDALESA